MSYPPNDPIELWINRVHRFALTLMDETVIIPARMNQSNELAQMGIGFESLETEPDPNRLQGVARQLSRLKQRTHMQLDPWLLAKGIRRLKQSNSR